MMPGRCGTMSLWSEEEVATLKEQWGKGRSTREIAVRLQTRSEKSVYKKVIALGLEPHKRAEAPPKIKLPRKPKSEFLFTTIRPPVAPSLELVELPSLPGEPSPVFPPVTILTAKNRQCRWPVGRADDMLRVCGHISYREESSWCPAHYRRAMRRAP